MPCWDQRIPAEATSSTKLRFFPFLLFPSTEAQSKLDFRTFFCVKAQEGHDFKGLFLRRTAGAFWTPFQKENKRYPSPGCSSEVMTQWKGNNKLRYPRGVRPEADNNEYLFYRILSKYFLSFNCHCYGVSVILYSEFRLLRSSNSTWRDVMPVIIVQIVFFMHRQIEYISAPRCITDRRR